MDDQRVGAALRALRVRRRLRQADLARSARCSRASISRIERGHVDSLSLGALRAVASALDVRLEIVPRWRGGELDRLLNAQHSAMHEQLARLFREAAGWVAQPEVSFSIYGERGVIDVLAWHAGRRALLVIELKTALLDVQELLGTLDRKRRLAPAIARERGWEVATVSTWLVVLSGRTNSRRVAMHSVLLRSVFPSDGRRVSGWLRDPSGPLSALSFLPAAHPRNARSGMVPSTRVRVRLSRRAGLV